MSDPGAVPPELPSIHPRLAYIIEQTDRFRMGLALHRHDPNKDAHARMRMIELEQMGVWYPELIPERGRRACETAMMAATMFLRRNNAGIAEIVNSLTGMVVGARAVAEAYERASQPGVLVGLNRLESCFEETDGKIIPVESYDEIVSTAIQLVTALRMQGKVPPHHEQTEESSDPA